MGSGRDCAQSWGAKRGCEVTAGGEGGVVGEWQGFDPPQARRGGRADVQICVGRLKSCCGEALEDNFDYMESRFRRHAPCTVRLSQNGSQQGNRQKRQIIGND